MSNSTQEYICLWRNGAGIQVISTNSDQTVKLPCRAIYGISPNKAKVGDLWHYDPQKQAWVRQSEYKNHQYVVAYVLDEQNFDQNDHRDIIKRFGGDVRDGKWYRFDISGLGEETVKNVLVCAAGGLESKISLVEHALLLRPVKKVGGKKYGSQAYHLVRDITKAYSQYCMYSGTIPLRNHLHFR